MEVKMKLLAMTLVMGFVLAPFAAHATTQHHHALHQPQYAQRHAIPKAATAFVPPPVKVNDDSDGLSRNHEDCNRGCIDN
jgi:hypothetical protein